LDYSFKLLEKLNTKTEQDVQDELSLIAKALNATTTPNKRNLVYLEPIVEVIDQNKNLFRQVHVLGSHSDGKNWIFEREIDANDARLALIIKTKYSKESNENGEHVHLEAECYDALQESIRKLFLMSSTCAQLSRAVIFAISHRSAWLCSFHRDTSYATWRETIHCYRIKHHEVFSLWSLMAKQPYSYFHHEDAIYLDEVCRQQLGLDPTFCLTQVMKRSILNTHRIYAISLPRSDDLLSQGHKEGTSARVVALLDKPDICVKFTNDHEYTICNAMKVSYHNDMHSSPVQESDSSDVEISVADEMSSSNSLLDEEGDGVEEKEEDEKDDMIQTKVGDECPFYLLTSIDLDKRPVTAIKACEATKESIACQ
jgi:hypothetical protein